MAGAYNVGGTTLVDGGENGGTVTFSGATPATTQSLTISGGMLTATGTVNVSGALTWLNGTISGTGSVNANGTLVLGAADGTSYVEVLNGGTLNNAGSGRWLSQAGYFDQQDGSVFNNLAGASLTIQRRSSLVQRPGQQHLQQRRQRDQGSQQRHDYAERRIQ